MLFKKGDRFTLVVKNKTHNGNPNKFTHLRVSKNKIVFKDTVAHEHRHMKLTNIFAITNITRLDEEQEQQTPTDVCKSKTCENSLIGWQSQIDKRYCSDCV